MKPLSSLKRCRGSLLLLGITVSCLGLTEGHRHQSSLRVQGTAESFTVEGTESPSRNRLRMLQEHTHTLLDHHSQPDGTLTHSHTNGDIENHLHSPLFHYPQHHHHDHHDHHDDHDTDEPHMPAVPEQSNAIARTPISLPAPSAATPTITPPTLPKYQFSGKSGKASTSTTISQSIPSSGKSGKSSTGTINSPVAPPTLPNYPVTGKAGKSYTSATNGLNSPSTGKSTKSSTVAPRESGTPGDSNPSINTPVDSNPSFTGTPGDSIPVIPSKGVYIIGGNITYHEPDSSFDESSKKKTDISVEGLDATRMCVYRVDAPEQRRRLPSIVSARLAGTVPQPIDDITTDVMSRPANELMPSSLTLPRTRRLKQDGKQASGKTADGKEAGGKGSAKMGSKGEVRGSDGDGKEAGVKGSAKMGSKGEVKGSEVEVRGSKEDGKEAGVKGSAKMGSKGEVKGSAKMGSKGEVKGSKGEGKGSKGVDKGSEGVVKGSKGSGGKGKMGMLETSDKTSGCTPSLDKLTRDDTCVSNPQIDNKGSFRWLVKACGGDDRCAGNLINTANFKLIEWHYEMTYNTTVTDSGNATVVVEKKITEYVTKRLLGCTGIPGTIIKSTAVGVDSAPMDQKVNETCMKLNTDNSTDLQCQRVDGQLIVYFEEGADITTEDEETALKVIKTGSNGTKFSDTTEGIVEIYYHGKLRPDTVGTVLVPGGNMAGRASALTDATENEEDSISGLGIFFIIFAVMGCLIIGFLATRRREQVYVKKHEEMEEEEYCGLSVDDHTEADTVCSPVASSRDLNRSLAHIMDNEDAYEVDANFPTKSSQFSDSQNTGNGESHYSSVNVHKCSSSTCAICAKNRANPIFIRPYETFESANGTRLDLAENTVVL